MSCCIRAPAWELATVLIGPGESAQAEGIQTSAPGRGSPGVPQDLPMVHQGLQPVARSVPRGDAPIFHSKPTEQI